MKKKAAEILHKQIQAVLVSKSAKELENAVTKIADLANILDQSGDEVSADRLDELIKQAGFFESLFSGALGASAPTIWNAIKGGKFKEELGDIVKKAIAGAATGVAVEYLIKWLDTIPFIGKYLTELEHSDKIREVFEGVVSNAIVNSDIGTKLVDGAVEAVEEMIGMAKKPAVRTQNKPTIQPPITTLDKPNPISSESLGKTAPGAKV